MLFDRLAIEFMTTHSIKLIWTMLLWLWQCITSTFLLPLHCAQQYYDWSQAEIFQCRCKQTTVFEEWDASGHGRYFLKAQAKWLTRTVSNHELDFQIYLRVPKICFASGFKIHNLRVLTFLLEGNQIKPDRDFCTMSLWYNQEKHVENLILLIYRKFVYLPWSPFVHTPNM